MEEQIKCYLALFIAMLMESLDYSKETINQVTILIMYGK